MVRVLLTSSFAMWMAWGPELTFFCNDAYRRDTLVKKYQWALLARLRAEGPDDLPEQLERHVVGVPARRLPDDVALLVLATIGR